jgi:hypothetical protein
LLERVRKEGVSVADFVRKAILASLNLPPPAQPEVGGRLSALEKRVSELEERIATLERAVFKQTGASQARAPNSAQQGGDTQQQGQKPRRTAWDILREQEIVCASTMKARDPDKIIDILRDGGAAVIASGSDRCAVYPDTWSSFVETLSKVGSPDEREALGRLKGKAKHLFKMLRAAGAVYYDSKAKRWVVDPGVVEEAGRAPGLASTGAEEAGEGKAGGKYVVRVPVEEAGGDPEKYMAEMERKGWLCNEAARQVICVWREALRLVVDVLNKNSVRVSEMEKALAEDKDMLEVAKAGYEAGLLWFDSSQGKWRAVY